jgi:hypothetical protein
MSMAPERMVGWVLSCALSAAWGASALAQPCACNGDVNGDGIIDITDFTIASGRQGCPIGTGDPLCDRSDVNCDGVVDLRDVRVVECQLGQAAPGDPACCDACRCSGDANGDGVIDLLDFQFVSSRFGCPVGTGNPGCDAADVNCDGFVDVRDTNVIQCQFGQAAPGDVTCCDVCDCSGDVNGDGQIDAVDIQLITLAIGCAPGDPGCLRADVDCDGDVDLRDLAIATCQFGPGRGDPSWCDDTPAACCFGCAAYPGGPSFVCADLSRLDCAFAQGIWTGPGRTCADVPCDTAVCPADLNGDGRVDVFDFGALSARFGATGTPGRCAGDLNCDGTVDVFDFSELTANFGCVGSLALPEQCCLPFPGP